MLEVNETLISHTVLVSNFMIPKKLCLVKVSKICRMTSEKSNINGFFLLTANFKQEFIGR